MKVSNVHFLEPFSRDSFTEPNQAFTPRQILEQFARGEVVPSINNPSDNIFDDGTNEDQLVNDVIEFEDKIDAENHLIENQYQPYEETSHQSGSFVPNGTSQTPAQTPSGTDGQSGGAGETS